jgi:hypothetical protein
VQHHGVIRYEMVCRRGYRKYLGADPGLEVTCDLMYQLQPTWRIVIAHWVEIIKFAAEKDNVWIRASIIYWSIGDECCGVALTFLLATLCT